MIRSFANELTEKIFFGEVSFSKKERKSLGDLNVRKAQEALKLLDLSTEKELMSIPSLSYHKLHGTMKYSIDANGRRSKWRITFEWENEEMKNVECVLVEDTH